MKKLNLIQAQKRPNNYDHGIEIFYMGGSSCEVIRAGVGVCMLWREIPHNFLMLGREAPRQIFSMCY